MPKETVAEQKALMTRLKQGAAAWLAGMSPRSFRDADCPSEPGGVYDAKAVVDWVKAKAAGTIDPMLTSGDSQNLERYRAAKADLAEMDVDQRRRKLIDVDEFSEWFSTEIATPMRRAIEAVVRTVGLVGVVLAAVGTAVTALGMAIMGVGAVLGAAASVLGAIVAAVAFALNPFVLLTAAVVGGIYAWTRWTTSGQNALRAITSFFGPLLQTAKDTIGGIIDALMGGDFELAGQIAVTGLQLAFAQGMAALSSMVGGTFGDLIGKITGQLLDGDLRGVWNTVVQGLAVVWAKFSQGIVSVFTAAAKVVVDVWESSVNAIADFMLRQRGANQ